MVYESHMLDFYLSHGCNVFFFNYRGFGRSTGRPTPSALASDADGVIEFLKKRGVTRIGVHGRSIGGIAACHLAKNNPGIVSSSSRTARSPRWRAPRSSLSATG